MRLSEMGQEGEEIFECDRCRIWGERKTFAVEENGGHYCFSCWLEKEHNRLTSRPVSAGF